jgi:hypothetical protein
MRAIFHCVPEKMGTAPQEGVTEIALTCISEGTLDIYIGSQLAQPHLIVWLDILQQRQRQLT